MKKAFIIIIVVLALVAVGVTWLIGSLDGIVKKQIEVVGTELTGTKVSVGGVSIALTDGAGSVTGLTVANPDGYSTDTAFSMALLRLGIDLASIGKTPLVLNELVIDAPLVTLEANEQGGSNLKTLSDNVSANTAAADDQAAKATGDSGGDPLRILIRKLVIQDVSYAVHSPGLKDPVKGTLPTVSLNNVGGSNGGTPGEIGKIVIRDLSERVLKEAAKAGIKSAIESKVKDSAGGGLGDALKKLGK